MRGALVRLGVLGDPLAYTLSPTLHRAGLAAIGLAGESEALRTAPAALADRLQELASRGFRGVNLTHPLKEAVLPHLVRVSDEAAEARSVNTVSFEADGPVGDTTDGGGFVDLLRELRRDPVRERVLILGAGGAARSLALALGAAGARVTASARDPLRARAMAQLGAACVRWQSAEEAEALAASTLLVNATPLSDATEPVEAPRVPAHLLAVDLVYGAAISPWTAALRATGRAAFDGLGLLVHQARRSLRLWTGREIPLEPLARAVGWPR